MPWRNLRDLLIACGCVAMFALGVLRGASARAQEIPFSTETTIATDNATALAISREQALVSGSVRFKVTRQSPCAEHIPDLLLLDQEVADGAFVDYAWFGSDWWRIQVRRLDESLTREMVREGSLVDTGDGTVWELSYLEKAGTEELKAEFNRLMWPHSIASDHHLFPMTFGKSPDFTTLYAAFTEEVEQDPANERTTVNFHMRTSPDMWHRVLSHTAVLDMAHGGVPAEITVRGSITFVAQYTDPFEATPGRWAPATCQYFAQPEGSERIALWTSTVVARNSRFGGPFQGHSFKIRPRPGARMLTWPNTRIGLDTDSEGASGWQSVAIPALWGAGGGAVTLAAALLLRSYGRSR